MSLTTSPKSFKRQDVIAFFEEMGATLVPCKKGDKLHLEGKSAFVPSYKEFDRPLFTKMKRDLGASLALNGTTG